MKIEGAVAVLALITGGLWKENHYLETNKVVYRDSKIPPDFKGYRILQVSDLHSQRFGKRQVNLIKRTKELEPDVIFLTGDMIDRNHTNIERSMDYLEEAVKIAPVICVLGNHEFEAKKGDIFIQEMRRIGIRVLKDEKIYLEKKESRIPVIGIDDPYVLPKCKGEDYDRISSYDFVQRLKKVMKHKEEGFTILLSHRPEFFHIYIRTGMSLIFSGHAHGGQFRIKKDIGLLAPHQGFFRNMFQEFIKRERQVW
ncbi:metallophosphoesterase [Murimonas intestini]|uniref:metallophosphoesterase n=1 Tax=Murimonas intestini TaxID=1337051 RepID=UPI0011DD8DD5|nr:metallophosphoesterase [Murimonas intestini]